MKATSIALAIVACMVFAGTYFVLSAFDPGEETIDSVIVEIDYGKNWLGSINVAGELETITGSGLLTRTVNRPTPQGEWDVIVSAQKLDGSAEQLVIRIKTLDGGVLAEKTTTMARGLVATTVKLG